MALRVATTKSDVYAFGVVLFEIMSGNEAIIQIQGSERQSLASFVKFFFKLLRHDCATQYNISFQFTDTHHGY